MSNLEAQIRSAIMSALEWDIIDGLTRDMSMENMAKFREYIKEISNV